MKTITTYNDHCTATKRNLYFDHYCICKAECLSSYREVECLGIVVECMNSEVEFLSIETQCLVTTLWRTPCIRNHTPGVQKNEFHYIHI